MDSRLRRESGHLFVGDHYVAIWHGAAERVDIPQVVDPPFLARILETSQLQFDGHSESGNAVGEFDHPGPGSTWSSGIKSALVLASIGTA